MICRSADADRVAVDFDADPGPITPPAVVRHPLGVRDGVTAPLGLSDQGVQ